jgi:hypothetical protein
VLNPLNAELNPICHLLALLGAHLIFHVSRIRVKHHTMKAYNGVEINLLAFFKLGTRQGRVVNFIARKLQIRGK